MSKKLEVSDFECLSRVCCECGVLLKKANDIRMRCQDSNKTLTRIIKKEPKISKSAITKYTTEEQTYLNFWQQDRHCFRKVQHKRSNKKTANAQILHELYIDHLNIPEDEVSKSEGIVNDVIGGMVCDNEIDSEAAEATLSTIDIKNRNSSEDIKKDIKEEVHPEYAEVTDLSECSTDDNHKRISKSKRSKGAKKKRRLQKIVSKETDKPSRRDLEILRELDKRYKNSDEFDEEFVVERFLTEEEQRGQGKYSGQGRDIKIRVDTFETREKHLQ
ncbi:hypothetical protein EVAR_30362_1 [Eumeta japonica]|uniref:Uncharacterized protein n=1 Tax=Eumeta variegata TaxID=151549 RepID=A0A4C1W7T9_EUMVA|nr:hypothetical protein EVAR_30362_1 [Eumeta japonica]